MSKALVVASPGRGVSPRFVALCSRWASEVGWELAATAADADAVILGPGAQAPPGDAPRYKTVAARGVDGFRWAIWHAAYTAASPPSIVSYGPLDDHAADVRRAGAGAPVAVVLHGGFWMREWHRDLMDGISVDLHARGWTTWNVEYRRVDEGGGWPQSKDDVVLAIKQAVADSPEGRVTLVGHSAGGQLALTAAAELGPQIVARVVSLAGVCGMALALSATRARGPVARFVGSAPVEQADPMSQLPLGIPTLLAHPAGDSIVPAALSRRYAEAARAAGDDVRLLAIDGDDHMSVVDPNQDWPRVAELL